jgi:hypothetical protein
MQLERAISREDGRSGARERRWGLIGGLVGSLAGLGAGAVAVLIDGVPPFEGGPWPSAFREPRLLAIDVYLLVVLVVGAGFSVSALLATRRGAFPRTDGYGAGLVGGLLTTLAGLIFFVRILALTTAGQALAR